MKKKIILLISAWLILTADPSGMDVSAATLSRHAAMSGMSARHSKGIKPPDGIFIQENGEIQLQPGDEASGQASEGIKLMIISHTSHTEKRWIARN